MLLRVSIILFTFLAGNFSANAFAETFGYVVHNVLGSGQPSQWIRKISRCRVNTSTGEFIDCLDTGEGVPSSDEITLNSDNTMAYFTNRYAGMDDQIPVTRCRIVPKTGMLKNCTSAGLEFPEIDQYYFPRRISFTSDNTAAFMAAIGEDPSTAKPISKIVRCGIDQTTGNFRDCKIVDTKDVAGNGIILPFGVTLSSGDTVAYVDYGVSGNDDETDISVLRCNINPTTGNFSGCAETSRKDGKKELNMPDSVQAIVTNKDDSLAFISGYDFNRTYPSDSLKWVSMITSCHIDPATKTFRDCTKFTDGEMQPISADVVLNQDESQVFFNRWPNLLHCKINPASGGLQNCRPAIGNVSHAFGIRFATLPQSQ